MTASQRFSPEPHGEGENHWITQHCTWPESSEEDQSATSELCNKNMTHDVVLPYGNSMFWGVDCYLTESLLVSLTECHGVDL